MAFRTYNPRRVTLSFKGFNISAFMDSTFIEAERNEDSFTVHVGANGDVTRTASHNRTGKVTVTLVQASTDNDFLMLILAADELAAKAGAGTSPGIGSLQIKDLSGTFRVNASQAWLTKPPKGERAKEAGSVQWIFECAEMEPFVGGNVI